MLDKYLSFWQTCYQQNLHWTKIFVVKCDFQCLTQVSNCSLHSFLPASSKAVYWSVGANFLQIEKCVRIRRLYILLLILILVLVGSLELPGDEIKHEHLTRYYQVCPLCNTYTLCITNRVKPLIDLSFFHKYYRNKTLTAKELYHMIGLSQRTVSKPSKKDIGKISLFTY